jgi:uncharacterized delta-60 repeat protein
MFRKTTTTARGRLFLRSRPARAVTRRRPIRFEALEGRTLLSGNFSGAQGTVVTPFAGAEVDQANSLLVQSDNKLVAVGISGQSVSLARYESSGALDRTFGIRGQVTTGFPSNSAFTDSAALEADQKILVATELSDPISGVVSSVLARYTTAGRLDPGFGIGGEIAVLAGANGDHLAVLPNGEIVVAGSLYNSSTSSESFVVEEYQANGALDTSFGTNGRVTTAIGASGGVTGIAVQGNDIIVAGDTYDFTTSTADLLVARYTATGALDASFGTGGLASYPAYGNGFTTGVATGPDGSIFVLGDSFSFSPTASYTTFVTHLTANGVLDGTYGSGGTATVGGVLGNAIAVQPDGKAVAGGTARYFAFTQSAVARFTTAGALDGSFGAGGLVTTAITSSDTVDAVALQPATPGPEIVTAGSGFNPSTGNDFALARYTTTGALDASFGHGGSLTTNFAGPVSAQANSVVSDGHGGFLVAGTTGSAGGSLTVADYGWDGRLNAHFGDGGTVQVTFNPYIFGIRANDGFVAVQPDGKILLVGTSVQPGTTSYDFAIARLLPDGELDRSFGVGGKLTTFSGAPDTDMAPSGGVVIQPDGKILVAGYTEDYSAAPFFVDKGVVVRYNKDGSLDTTFGTGGRETFDLSSGAPDRVTGMALEPNGEILLGGFVSDPTTFNENYFLEKLHANGTPDTAFAPLGQIVTGFSGLSGTFDFGAPLLLRPDGSILVGGSTFDPNTFQSYMTVAQFTAAGAVDSSFGNDGQASISFPGDPNSTFGDLANMALQRNGDVIVVGTYNVFDPTTFAFVSSQFAVARFTSSGTVDTTFGNGGMVLTSVGGYEDSAAAVLVGPDGTFVVVGATYDTTALQNDFAVVAYNADGTLFWVKKHRRD